VYLFSIHLKSAFYQVVNTSGDLNQSPVIRGLLAKDIASGKYITAQVLTLKEFENSHIWVFHNTNSDVGH
jgi:DNA polymerase-3 subunit epsilon